MLLAKGNIRFLPLYNGSKGNERGHFAADAEAFELISRAISVYNNSSKKSVCLSSETLVQI